MSIPAPIIEFPPFATSGRFFNPGLVQNQNRSAYLSVHFVGRRQEFFLLLSPLPPSIPKTRQFRAKYRKNTSSPMRQNSFGRSFPIGS